MTESVEFVLEDDNPVEIEQSTKKKKRVRFEPSQPILTGDAPQADGGKKSEKRSRKNEEDEGEEESEEEEKPKRGRKRSPSPDRGGSDASDDDEGEGKKKSKKSKPKRDSRPTKSRKSSDSKSNRQKKKKRRESEAGGSESSSSEEEEPKKAPPAKKAKPKPKAEQQQQQDGAGKKPTAADRRKQVRTASKLVQLPDESTLQRRNGYRLNVPFAEAIASQPLDVARLGADRAVYYLCAKRGGTDDKPTTSVSYVVPEGAGLPEGADHSALGLACLIAGQTKSIPKPEPGTITAAAAEVARALTKGEDVGPLLSPLRVEVMEMTEGADARVVDFGAGWTKLSVGKRNYNIRCLLYTGDDAASQDTRIEVLVPTPDMLDEYDVRVVPARAFVQVTRGMRVRIRGAPRRMCLCFVVTSHLKELHQHLEHTLASPTADEMPSVRFDPPKPRAPKPAPPTTTVEEQMVDDHATGFVAVPEPPAETEVVAADGLDSVLAQLKADMDTADVLGPGTGTFGPATVKDGETRPLGLFGAKVAFRVDKPEAATADLVGEVSKNLMQATGLYKGQGVKDRHEHAHSVALSDGTDISYQLMGWRVPHNGAMVSMWGVVVLHRKAPDTLIALFFNNAQQTKDPNRLKSIKDAWSIPDKSCSPLGYPTTLAEVVRKPDMPAKLREMLLAKPQ